MIRKTVNVVLLLCVIPMILAGCGQKFVASNETSKNVSWDSVPSDEQQVILNVSKKYGDVHPKVVKVFYTLTDNNQQPMYLISLNGTFHKGNTKGNHLEFSILANGSQTWAVSIH